MTNSQTYSSIKNWLIEANDNNIQKKKNNCKMNNDKRTKKKKSSLNNAGDATHLKQVTFTSKAFRFFPYLEIVKRTAFCGHKSSDLLLPFALDSSNCKPSPKRRARETSGDKYNPAHLPTCGSPSLTCCPLSCFSTSVQQPSRQREATTAEVRTGAVFLVFQC